MNATLLTQTLFSLPVAERIDLADRLYASVPKDWQAVADQAWLDEALQRSDEMDANPGMELSHEEFMAGILLKQDRKRS